MFTIKNNLLIICCGKDSLHQQWVTDHSTLSFDLCLLVYDETNYSDLNSSKARYTFNHKGYKFENISRFVTKDIYRQYDFIGIIDDDILTTPEDIDTLFAMGRKHNFDLFQPSYSREGHPSHVDFLATEPQFDFRLFNTVEIMCPFFSQRAYNVVCNEFDTSPYKMGYGLEYAFEKLLSSQNGQTVFGGYVAVVDKIVVKHCNPITQRFEISEADIWYYRNKYQIPYLRVFDRNIITGVKIES